MYSLWQREEKQNIKIRKQTMKIKFKNITDSLDFTKIFPVIDADDYSLLAGRELTISDNDYEKIKEKGFLDVKPYQISIDLIEQIGEDGISATQQKVLNKINEHTVYQEKLVDVLFKGFELGKNVLMYGRGGHNKSEGTLDVLKELKAEGLINSDPFVMSFGDGLTEESLFGGMNVKKFTDDGIMEYLFKNSFLEHEIVVFEEIFDAPPQVLLSLKDVLTSGYARKGNQIHKSKVKMVIALTNKSKEEFAEDDSLEALTQRFPLTLKVEWPSYSKSDFIKLYKKVFGEDFYKANASKLNELSDIISQNNASQESFVSPRTAIHAASLYVNGGDLSYISDISPKILNDFYKANKDRVLIDADELVLKRAEEYIEKNELNKVDIDKDLLKMLVEVQEKRTGEKIDINLDQKDKLAKLKKAEFLQNAVKAHSFSVQRKDAAEKMISRISHIISNLK